MAVLRILVQVLFLYVCSTVAPPPPTADPVQQGVTPEQQRVFNLIRQRRPVVTTTPAQVPQTPPTQPSNVQPQGLPVPTRPPGAASLLAPGEKPPPTSYFGLPKIIKDRVTQVTGVAQMGKDMLMNVVYPKKARETILLDLNTLIQKMELSILTAKNIVTNNQMMSDEELQNQIQAIKNELKPIVVGENQILSQVKKTQENIKQVVKNPASLQDYQVVQAIANHEATKALTNRVASNPITQQVVKVATPLAQKLMPKPAEPEQKSG